MAEPSLIKNYRDALSRELPRRVADEVADGLAETVDKYLKHGLSQDAATVAAVAEFGDPRSVVDAFSQASPFRPAARRLVLTGPVVGLCWGALLITDRAWNWAVPPIAPVLAGLTLAAVIISLATAALAHSYRLVRRCATAACISLTVLDAGAVTAVMAFLPGIRWLAVVAACASASRLTYVARIARPLLSG
jgi:hypothetical protein